METPSPDQPHENPTVDPASATPTSDDRNMSVLCHVLGLFTSILGPLILWLVMREKSPFIDFHGKQAVNFNITMVIAYFVSGLSMCLYIGILLVPVVMILQLVFTILAAMKASQGERYVIPIAIPIIN